MPDGMNLGVRPDLATAKSFWSLFTGDPDAPIRLRFLWEGSLEDATNYDTGQVIDPLDGLETGMNSRGQPNKPRSFEMTGTLDQLWPEVVRLQTVGRRACYYFPNRVRDGEIRFATDADVDEIRALFIDCDH